MSKKYKRNYLDSVILRVDFDRIGDNRRLTNFLKLRIDPLYPYKEEKHGFSGSIKIDITKDKVEKSKKEEVTIWSYLDAYKNKRVEIAHNFIAIEYLNRSYTDSKELLKDCEDVLATFIDELSVSKINRLGLRYINRFDFDVDISEMVDWSKFFAKDLVGNVSFAKKLKYPIIRAMSNLHYRISDHDVLVRSGLWNQDFPSENMRKEFIVDIDTFSRFVIDDPSRINSIVKEYNKDVEKIFEKIIGAESKKLLNKKND